MLGSSLQKIRTFDSVLFVIRWIPQQLPLRNYLCTNCIPTCRRVIFYFMFQKPGDSMSPHRHSCSSHPVNQIILVYCTTMWPTSHKINHVHSKFYHKFSSCRQDSLSSRVASRLLWYQPTAVTINTIILDIFRHHDGQRTDYGSRP